MSKKYVFSLFIFTFLFSLCFLPAVFAELDEDAVGPASQSSKVIVSNPACTENFFKTGSRNVLFYEDFSDGDMNGWMDAGGGYTTSVTTTTAADGTLYSLQQTGGNSSHFDGSYINFSAVTPGYISIWMNSGSNTTSDTYFVIGDSNTTSNYGIIFFYSQSAGVWRVYTDTGYNLAAYAPNTWYHIEFTVYWGTQTLDVYIDGALQVSGIPFRSTATTSLSQIHLYHFQSASGWWDQIFLSDSQTGNAFIGDRVWYDSNLNGGQDAGEPGLMNIDVDLYTSGGSLVASTLTDPNGLFMFNDVTPGDYYLDFTLPLANYYFSPLGTTNYDADSNANTTTGQTTVTTLSAGENDPNWDAGMWSDPLAVELLSFEAAQRPRGVLLKWATASEIDVLGFNVYRKNISQICATSELTQVNTDLIPSEGSASSGASYQLIDSEVTPGATYIYYLQAIETNGIGKSLAETEISIVPSLNRVGQN